MKNGLMLMLSVLSVFSLSGWGENFAVPIQQDVNLVKQKVNDKSANIELSGSDLFAIACQACHSVMPDDPHRVGPNLYGILGEVAASRAGFKYSEALKQSGLTWDKNNLLVWIVATEGMMPGTWMRYHNVLMPDEVPRLIEYIEQVSSNPDRFYQCRLPENKQKRFENPL